MFRHMLRGARITLLRRRVHKIVDRFDDIMPCSNCRTTSSLKPQSLWLRPTWEFEPDWLQVIQAGTALGFVDVEVSEVRRWVELHREDRIASLLKLARRGR